MMKETHVIERILEERATTGRAKRWYLVQWEGYHPSWETWRIMGSEGDPLVTWEPLKNVRRSAAYEAWREASSSQ